MDLIMGDQRTVPDLKNFADLEGVQEVHYEDVWMSDHEYLSLQQFRGSVTRKLIGLTLGWAALHVASIVISPYFSRPGSGLSRKEELRWHNKAVSLLHAAVAFVQGVWWILGSGEYGKTSGRVFGFYPISANIAALGAAYFFYDFAFCTLASFVAWDKQLPMILVHHIIFIAAYFSTLVYPCVLSVTTYHYFQLTELSTVMLHVVWMFSKMQVQYRYLYLGTIALLATFLQRLITTFFILWHVVTTIIRLELWSVKLPYGVDQYNLPYCIYFAVCSFGMMMMNWTWFTLLVARAKEMVRRVQNGLPPSPDYERKTKKDE